MLLTNTVTRNAGRVGRVVAPVAAAGTNQASATPLGADVSLLDCGACRRQHKAGLVKRACMQRQIV